MKKEKMIIDNLEEIDIPLEDKVLRKLKVQKEKINKKLKKKLQEVYE